MKIRQSNLAIFAILTAIMGPVAGAIYIYLIDFTRGPLNCTPDKWCADFRGLDDIPIAIGIWVALHLMAVIMTILAIRQRRAYYKLATVIIITIPVLAFVVALLSSLH